MKKIFVGLMLCLAFNLAHAQEIKWDTIDKKLNEVLSSSNAVGFSVAVVKGKKVIYSKGFGYRDLEKKKRVNENTLFAIGSSTKAFTAAVLGQLEDENKLSLTDKPSKYLHDLHFYNDDLNNKVTILDMMAHRTGLPRHDFSWYLFPSFSSDSLMKRIAYQEPSAGVREKWMYNNFMYLVQGVLAERITKKSWGDNITERFLKPLNMNRSNTSIAALEKSSNKSLGYDLDKNNEVYKLDYYKIAGMRAAGSINSSAIEMANWLIAWINKGEFKGQSVIPEKYLSLAIQSQMVMRANLPGKKRPGMHFANYGLGWMLSSYNGHYRVEHGGNIDGFSANVAFYPSDSIGVVVLSNQNNSPVPGYVRNIIVDNIFNIPNSTWLEDLKEGFASRVTKLDSSKAEEVKSAVTPSHELIEYTGKYAHKGYGTFEVVLDSDSLWAIFPIRKYYLRPSSHDVFEAFEKGDIGIESKHGILVNFASNTLGEISTAQIEFESSLDPIVFDRTAKAMELSKETLDKYIGVYGIKGLEIKIYLKEKNKLYAFVSGQPEYELIAIGGNKFNLKGLKGYQLEFVKELNGDIKKLKMKQPNGTFVATKKEK